MYNVILWCTVHTQAYIHNMTDCIQLLFHYWIGPILPRRRLEVPGNSNGHPVGHKQVCVHLVQVPSGGLSWHNCAMAFGRSNQWCLSDHWVQYGIVKVVQVKTEMECGECSNYPDHSFKQSGHWSTAFVSASFRRSSGLPHWRPDATRCLVQDNQDSIRQSQQGKVCSTDPIWGLRPVPGHSFFFLCGQRTSLTGGHKLKMTHTIDVAYLFDEKDPSSRCQKVQKLWDELYAIDRILSCPVLSENAIEQFEVFILS